MLITCKLEEKVNKEEFDPFPGEKEAKIAGCSCPIQWRWPQYLVFNSECKVHELEKVSPN